MVGSALVAGTGTSGECCDKVTAGECCDMVSDEVSSGMMDGVAIVSGTMGSQIWVKQWYPSPT